jgi:hypothetical protein
MGKRARHGASILVVACLVLLGLTACGSGGDSSAASPPPGRSPRSLNAVFDALPRYPRAKATGPVTRSDQGTIVRSYLVQGASAQQVLEYFVDTLPDHGFEPDGAPTAQGSDSTRGTWRSGKRTLVLTVTAAPTAGGAAADSVATQYSFLLSPPGVTVS